MVNYEVCRGPTDSSLVSLAFPGLQCPPLDISTTDVDNLEMQETVLIIKPDVSTKPEAIENVHKRLADASLQILVEKRILMNQKMATAFYGQLADKFFFPDLVSFIASGEVIVLVVRGFKAIARIREMVGPTDPAIARQQHPSSLRATFGKDKTKNGFHASDHPESVAKELNVLCNLVA